VCRFVALEHNTAWSESDDFSAANHHSAKWLVAAFDGLLFHCEGLVDKCATGGSGRGCSAAHQGRHGSGKPSQKMAP
jgi:hypothetical protein